MWPSAVAIISMAMAASTMPMSRLEMLCALGDRQPARTWAARLQALENSESPNRPF